MAQPEWAKDLSYPLWVKLLTSIHLMSDLNTGWDKERVIEEICGRNLAFRALRPYMSQSWDHLQSALSS